MEQQLKRRLVGAIVLVSLAVIFIPVILEGPDDEWLPRDHTIPVPPRVDYRAAMELPLPETQPETQAPPPTEAEQPQSEVEQPQPEPEATAAAEPPGKALARPTPEAQPATQAAADTGQLQFGWYAQVGSFSQPDNAGRLRDKISNAGFSAHLQQVASAKGTSYRVLVGPEPTRDGAEQLLARLGKALNVTGIVIEIDAATN